MPKGLYFDVAFADGGAVSPVPDDVQPDGSVSYEQGYGPDYTLPPTSPGSRNVENTEFNQILNDVTLAIQQLQQNGIPPFIDSTMTTDGNPYPYTQYAQVLYLGVAYQSLVAGNTDTPPSSKWNPIPLSAANIYTGGVTTGSANNQTLASLSPATGFSMTINGQQIVCTAGFTNTGAMKLNITSLGLTNIDVKKISGGMVVPLAGGEVIATAPLYLTVDTAANCLIVNNGPSLGALATLNIGANLFNDGAGNLATYSARQSLIANANYYVATTGNDANPGTIVSPFLTIQHALNIAKGLDFNGFTVTINVAAGTYNAGNSLNQALVGASNQALSIIGASSATTLISSGGADCFALTGGASIFIDAIKLTCTGTSNGISVDPVSIAYVGAGVDFGACGAYHMLANRGIISAQAGYKVSGGAISHIQVGLNGNVNTIGSHVTYSGVPVFTGAYINATVLGTISCSAMTFTSTFAGKRYNSDTNSVINTATANVNYFPGTIAGTTSAGGVYV